MDMSLSGCKIAILAAGGFTEQDVTQIQRVLRQAGADIRIISSDNGLISGWNGTGWGLNFAVDASISTALGSDYDVVIIPGGQRSIDKLKLTGHTRRFINSFLDAGKPVVAMNDAVALLAMVDVITGRTVCGPADVGAVVMQHGGLWEEAASHIDGCLMSGVYTGESADFIEAMAAFILAAGDNLEQVAA